MKLQLYVTAAAFVAALAITSLSPAFVSPAFADGGCLSGCEPAPKSKGNNGFGQEKHGAVQDGENPGSDNGNLKNRTSKRNGSGLR